MDDGGYLPPEPTGPEPDLGAPPAPPEPPPPPPPAQQAYGNPFATQAPAWQQPPAQSWQPPPPGWHPPPAHPQPWGWQAPPAVPDNGHAVAGFVLSTVAATLLVLSAGLSSIVSIICAGLGVLYSLRGRRKVDRGESPKHRGLAQAGFIIGVISLVLAVLATVGWILLFVFADLDELDSSGDPNGFETSVRVLARIAVLLPL